MTMGSVQEPRQSLTPELRKRRKRSTEVVPDTEKYKASPRTVVSDSTVEHSSPQFVSPISAQAQQDVCVTAATVDSSHNEYYNTYIGESLQHSDAAAIKISLTDTETELSLIHI